MSDTTGAGLLLREAAKLMRERAQEASPGPWERHQDKAHLDPLTIFGHAGTRPDALTHVANVELGWRRDADAAHIASWHPAVALAIADWLEDEEAKFGHLADDQVFEIICAKALTTARAYLGRAS